MGQSHKRLTGNGRNKPANNGLDDDVKLAIATFRKLHPPFNNPDEFGGECGIFTTSFDDFCTDRGLNLQRAYLFGQLGHSVNLSGMWVIDWTARQFEEHRDAPYPWVYKLGLRSLFGGIAYSVNENFANKKMVYLRLQEDLEKLGIARFPEKDIDLRWYLARSKHTQLILHGMVGTPGLDIRQGYSQTWEEKIRYAVTNHPHIAAKQIYPTSPEFDRWYPVGLIVGDGLITSCSGLSDTLANGDRVPIKEKAKELEGSLEEKLESARGYEVAVKHPEFSAVYLHDYPTNYQVVPRLSVQSVKELAQSLGLPTVIFKNVGELFVSTEVI